MNAARTSSLSGDEDSTDDGSSDEEVYVDLRTLAAQSELPNDFWQVSLGTYFNAYHFINFLPIIIIMF